MKYTCSIEHAVFHAYHGLYPEEKLTGGTFIVDVHVTCKRKDADPMNSLTEMLNYEALFQLIQSVMQQREDLIETVAANILSGIPELADGIIAAKVKIQKPNPAGLFKTGTAAVELERVYS